MIKYEYRHTKVVFTIGPATESEEVLAELILAGVDICRLNMAHASREWTRTTVGRIRNVCARVGRQIAIMMDVKGPEIRTGDLAEPWDLVAGELVDFKTDPQSVAFDRADVRAVAVNYPNLHRNLKPGDTILVDSGLIRLVTEEVLPDRVRGRVVIPGRLGNRRHINLPGVHVDLPCLTEKDKADMDVGIELGIPFFALSFVRSTADLDMLRQYLCERGSKAQIISKIEDQSAIANLTEIIKASDGLMIARGDLGIECPFEQLPLIQRRAIRESVHQGKFVIVATHMLESMIQSPIPTRAEVTDVANAVQEMADCVMLSAETTVGRYPVESVRVMNRIARHIEFHQTEPYNKDLPLTDAKAKMLRSAVTLAQDLGNAGIIVFTRSGRLARTLSSLRPTQRPIFAFTDVPCVLEQMLPLWGIEPFLMPFSKDSEKTINDAYALLRDKHWVMPGQWMVIIANVLAGERIIDSIQMRKMEFPRRDRQKEEPQEAEPAR